ncbi:hypothetical protein NBRC116585_26040 [Thalassolituus maritimus]|uniref:Uncharacterized protein n=1 Tax=Thalassolituus maritimus TaxID=484498 RepID=A0ABQ0A263_9GAMM
MFSFDRIIPCFVIDTSIPNPCGRDTLTYAKFRTLQTVYATNTFATYAAVLLCDGGLGMSIPDLRKVTVRRVSNVLFVRFLSDFVGIARDLQGRM